MTASLPIHRQWIVRTICPDGYDSGWVLSRKCPGPAGYATINAMKGSGSGCSSVDLDCPPNSCPDDDPRDVEEAGPTDLI